VDVESTVLHLLCFSLGDLTGRLGHFLQVLTSLVTPEHVLEGRFVKVVVDVVECVLGDVTNDQVGVLPNLTTLVLLHFACEELNQRRLARTVGTEDSDTGRKGNLEGDVVQLLNGLRRVLEANFAHLEQALLLSLDTLEERRVRELELVVLGSFESVVRLCLRNLLDEGFEVTAISLNLEAVDVEDIGDGVVKEARVVRDDDCTGIQHKYPEVIEQ
jgi:hypothetical protein